jgi:hypothetical protein
MTGTLKEHASIAVDRGRLPTAMKAWIFCSVLLLVAAWVGVFFDPAGIVPHAVMLFWPLWLGAWIATFCSMRYPLERARHTLFQLEITSLTAEGLARSFMRRPVKLGLILLAAAAPLYMLPHQRDLFAIAANPVSHAFTATMIMRPVMFGLSIFGHLESSRYLIGRCGIFESICSGGLSLLMDAFRLYAVAAVATAASIRSRRAWTAFLEMVVRITALLIATAIFEITIGVNLLLFVCGILPDWLGGAITVFALGAIAGWLHSYWRQRVLLGRTATEASGVPAIDGLAAELFKSGRVLAFVGGGLCLALGAPLALISLFAFDGETGPIFLHAELLWSLSLIVLLTGLIVSLELCFLNIKNRKQAISRSVVSAYKSIAGMCPRLWLWTSLLITIAGVAAIGASGLIPLSWGFTNGVKLACKTVSITSCVICLLASLILATVLFRFCVITWCRETQSCAKEGTCWSLRRAKRWYASSLLTGLLLASTLTGTGLHIRALSAIVNSRYYLPESCVSDHELLLRMPVCVLGNESISTFIENLSQAESLEIETDVKKKLLAKKEIVASWFFNSMDQELLFGSFGSDSDLCLTAMAHPAPWVREWGLLRSYFYFDRCPQIFSLLLTMADKDPVNEVRFQARITLVKTGMLTEQFALYLALDRGVKKRSHFYRTDEFGLRPFGKRVVPSLVSALDGEYGKRALLLLSKMGPLAREAVPALMTKLDDSDSGNRKLAIKGLAMIGPAARAALPMLRKIRRTGTIEENALAGYAIWRITGESKGVAIDLLKISNYDLLKNMGPAANEIQPQLFKYISYFRRRDEERLIVALGRTPVDPVPQLIKLLQKTSPGREGWDAAQILARIEPAPAQALKNLLFGISDKHESWKYIPNVLLRMGPPDPLTVKALEQQLFLQDEKLHYSERTLLLLLSRAKRVSQKTAAILSKTMNASYSPIESAVACYHLNIDRKKALKTLINMAGKKSYSAIDALGRIGGAAAKSVPVLKKILDENSERGWNRRGLFRLRISISLALWRITGDTDLTISIFRKILAEPYGWRFAGIRILKAIGEMGADAESLIPDIERQMNMSFPNLTTNRLARKTIAKIKAAVKAQKASPSVLRDNPPR